MVPAARLLDEIRLDGLYTESRLDESDAALRARLREDGYLFFRGLVDATRLMRVRRDILQLCRDAGWLAEATSLMEGIFRGGAFPDYSTEYMTLYRELINLPSFNDCSRAPELVALFTRLLDGEVLVHPRNIARISFPRHFEFTTQPHQDFFYIHGTPDTYTTWIPVGDCPRELGGLALQEGSHHSGPLTHVATIGAGGNGALAEGRWLGADYRAGDIVLFHSYTVHGALDNHTPDLLRMSLDYRYQRADQPVDPSSLRPHGG